MGGQARVLLALRRHHSDISARFHQSPVLFKCRLDGFRQQVHWPANIDHSLDFLFRFLSRKNEKGKKDISFYRGLGKLR